MTWMPPSPVTRALWLVAFALHLSQVDLEGQASGQTGAGMLSIAACPACVSVGEDSMAGRGPVGPFRSPTFDPAGRRADPPQESEEEDGGFSWVRTGGLFAGTMAAGYTAGCVAKEHHGLGRCAQEGLGVAVAVPIIAVLILAVSHGLGTSSSSIEASASSLILDSGQIATPSVVVGEAIEIGLRVPVSLGVWQ